MSPPVVLVVGSSDPSSGVNCADVLADLAARRVEHVANLPAARDCLAGDPCLVELVLLCESRRGQYPAAAIDELRAVAPLVRFWRVLGSWHEGEPRSGRSPAGCTNTYWHQWPARAGREIVENDASLVLSLPFTASAEERMLAEAAEPIERRSGTVVVCASRFESAAALADVCRMAGYDSVIVNEDAPFHAADAVALLWDTTPEQMGDPSCVEKLRRGCKAPIVAVVSFPRPDDIRRARLAGVSAVVSKPFLVRDLLWQIGYVAER